MRLIIEGNINNYYAQSLCLLFFPNEKFSEKYNSSKNKLIKLKAIKKEDSCIGFAYIKYEGIIRFSHYSIKLSKENYTMLAVGGAFINAANKIFGYIPSWGIITGVRPTKVYKKLIYEYHNENYVKNELKKYYFLNDKKIDLLSKIEKSQKLCKNTDKKSCSIYISIPFCPSRCNYCSFISSSSPKHLELIPKYLEILEKEILSTSKIIDDFGYKVSSIYIGGGTPTVLNTEQLKILFGAVLKIDLSNLNEFSLEAGRPDTISDEKLKIVKDNYVTRICINPQTLNEKVLVNVNRKHTVEDFYNAYNISSKYNFDVNVDLIAGLPGDTYDSFKNTINKIIELEPQNITIHSLALKKSSEFKKVVSFSKVDTEICEDSIDYSEAILFKKNYFPYYLYKQKNVIGNLENVGYSLRDHFCIYNINMMEDKQTIFSFGAGAMTKIVNSEFNASEKIIRISNCKYPFEYIKNMSDKEYLDKRKNDLINNLKKCK